jgi:enoyl-CoA hydratase/carnithine racemase
VQPYPTYPDIGVSLADRVAVVELRRPPNNFFDRALIQQLREAFELFDGDDACRALVLCAEGKNFCSGADFSKDGRAQERTPAQPLQVGSNNLYKEAVRLFRFSKPIVAAIQGAAVGGGLGLAMVADFRVACPEARFVANFTRLGTHPGFGLTVTLPRLIGTMQAEMMFYTGDRIPGEKAVEMGLANLLVPLVQVRSVAIELAARIAQNAPLALSATRATMRRGLADAVEAATDHEFVEQDWLFRTRDFREGVRAMAAREIPDFQGH